MLYLEIARLYAEMSSSYKDSPCMEMKFLDRCHLPKLISLEAIIAENLTSSEIFLLHDQNFFGESVCQPNSAIGIFAGADLIAYSILRIPCFSGQAMPDNLGMDINLPADDLIKVAHIQAMAIHPDYRGHGLQRKPACTHLTLAEDSGYHHILCTVSPNNQKSLANTLSCGFQIEALCAKFRGWLRFILHRDLKNDNLNSARDASVRTEQIAISATDLKGHQIVLKRGFKGIKMETQFGHQCTL